MMRRPPGDQKFITGATSGCDVKDDRVRTRVVTLIELPDAGGHEATGEELEVTNIVCV